MSVFMSSGAIQLLVGPESFSSTEQMKVRSSTRATSLGSDAHQKELGFLSSLSRTSVPASTSWSVSSAHSSGVPVIQRMSRGCVSSATSSTQACRPAWVEVCVVSVVVNLPIPFARWSGTASCRWSSAMWSRLRRGVRGAGVRMVNK